MATASAPGKVILFGEHAVNRRQPAVAAGVDLRVRCSVSHIESRRHVFKVEERSGAQERVESEADLLAFKARVDGLRRSAAYEEIQSVASLDFFAPAKYALAHLLAFARERGIEPGGFCCAWDSDIPIAIGLGSGAAASAAMLMAAGAEMGLRLPLESVARMAWHGDVIAHGGIASGLDSGGCTYGGFIRYTLKDGAEPFDVSRRLPLVIGDTGVRANTAHVNERVRRWERENPCAAEIFQSIGELAVLGEQALRAGDLRLLGDLMNRNHDALRTIGVSCPELESLVGAALEAGALGAKVAGSGGGGIMVATAMESDLDAVAHGIESAGGRAFVTLAGTDGVRVEPAATRGDKE